MNRADALLFEMNSERVPIRKVYGTVSAKISRKTYDTAFRMKAPITINLIFALTSPVIPRDEIKTFEPLECHIIKHTSFNSSLGLQPQMKNAHGANEGQIKKVNRNMTEKQKKKKNVKKKTTKFTYSHGSD
ncbi:hypothetical protein CAEBREN_19809 [Caenorhabditis brenneri]|uniref:Uncharacterized protein n=1 Tax=Caenorhabditis brenneri TaxID=135651 RepID=G0M6L0_CAEBE|nr:hypothetical protein CAEBREN_19809 [Caenorhabditis brenneri]